MFLVPFSPPGSVCIRSPTPCSHRYIFRLIEPLRFYVRLVSSATYISLSPSARVVAILCDAALGPLPSGYSNYATAELTRHLRTSSSLQSCPFSPYVFFLSFSFRRLSPYFFRRTHEITKTSSLPSVVIDGCECRTDPVSFFLPSFFVIFLFLLLTSGGVNSSSFSFRPSRAYAPLPP